jgi:hypothetical protein
MEDYPPIAVFISIEPVDWVRTLNASSGALMLRDLLPNRYFSKAGSTFMNTAIGGVSAVKSKKAKLAALLTVGP